MNYLKSKMKFILPITLGLLTIAAIASVMVRVTINGNIAAQVGKQEGTGEPTEYTATVTQDATSGEYVYDVDVPDGYYESIKLDFEDVYGKRLQ